ncbi:MAG: hypothetical protein IKU03_03195 [Bacteroidales bacterium]|nr:hypothetical protein [Bacteroidales bacterium]
MKAFRPLLLCTLLVAGMLSGMAQVKQIFKVSDAVTGKPLAGAKLVLNGQQLQTNAKGVAVAVLPNEFKGAYLSHDWWYLDGYSALTYMGRYQWGDVQSSDTLFSYMIPDSLYEQGVTNAFMKLFGKDINLLTDKIRDAFQESKDDPDSRDDFAQRMFDTEGTLFTDAGFLLSDALDITNITYNDRTMPAEMKELLLDGKINEAVTMAREQIVPNDRSHENLIRIARYMDLRTLYTSTEDTSKYSDYSRILYEQKFNLNSTVSHLHALGSDNLYDEWKEVSDKERKNNRVPVWEVYFEDPAYQNKNIDNERFVQASENRVKKVKELAPHFTYNDFCNVLSNQYQGLYDAYYTIEDSLKASDCMDSLLYYRKHYLETYNQGVFRNDVVGFWSLFYPTFQMTDSYMPINNDKIINISFDLMNLCEHLYRNYPDNDMAQLLYGITGYNLYNLFQTINDEHDSILSVEKKLNEIQQILVKKYPEYFSVANMQISSDIYWRSLSAEEEGEAVLKQYFQNYRASHDIIQQLYPLAFLRNYLRFNNVTEAYMNATGQFKTSNELNDFTNELLKMQALEEKIPFEAAKAKHYNNVAERLYKWELYEQGVSQYQLANDYFKQAVSRDHHWWIPYLTNYLQMGDAYLYSEQYDQAIASYRKILAEEPNIPSDIMPQYLNLKGSAYWFEGDVYRTQKNLSAAEKCYKTAEKWMRKAIAAGDSTTFRSLGEMYFTKGINTYQQGNEKKAYQLIRQSEEYYGTYPLETPSDRYESVLQIMEEYYKDQNDIPQYFRVQKEKAAYYKQFAHEDLDYMTNYAESTRKIANLESDPNLKIAHEKELIETLTLLNQYKDGMDVPYMQANYALAEVYRGLDSAEQAIPYYEECLRMNDLVFKDTSYTKWRGNLIDIDIPLAACYQGMADVDTANRKQWFLKAINTRDTLTELMEQVCRMDTNDINMAYKLSFQHYRNALCYAQAELLYMGLEKLDKSDAILLKIYNGEYRSAVEEDLVRNYWLRGAIYEEDEDYDKAKELYSNAVKFADNATNAQSVAHWAVVSISSMIDLLENDPTADPNEIKVLKQKLAYFAKLANR